MRTFYNGLFGVFFLLSSPYYFWRMRRRGGWRQGFAQRFGKFDAKFKQSITNRHSIWLHAVSVGEVGICARLIKALEPRVPNIKIIVSTTTTTGMAELERQLPAHISKIYYPIDRKKWVTRALTTIHPEAIVMVEAEIWPNFLWRARDMAIPVFLVNARLSDRSFPRYKAFGFIFRQLFASFAGVGAQSESDAARLVELGCRQERVRVAGSLKFDSARPDERKSLDVAGMLSRLGVPAGARVIVAGSTHAGEEALLAAMVVRLKARFPDLFLVLVPRHFERAREVGQELERAGVRFAYRTDVGKTAGTPAKPVECLLVNSTGELRFFYQAATVVFVGKSLTAKGGQNPIEPGAMGKAMVFGPNMQNFREIVAAFLAAHGAVQVADPGALERELAALLEDGSKREHLGRNALQVVQSNLGAIDRTVEMIVEHLRAEEVYVAPGRQAGPTAGGR